MSKSLKGVAKGEYKGNAMVVIDGDARYPFQFGAGKAVMLLLACAANGIGPMFALLQEVAGDKLNQSKDNPKGLSAKHVEALNAELLKLSPKPRTSKDRTTATTSDKGKQAA